MQRPLKGKLHAHALFFAAFAFADLAFCTAAAFFSTVADSVGLRFIGTILCVFRAFAPCAPGAVAGCGRSAAEKLRTLAPFAYALPKAAMAAVIPDSSLCNRSSSFFSKSKTPFKTNIPFFLLVDSIHV